MHFNIARCLQVPVGRETLGRIINVLGEPVDEVGPIGKHRNLQLTARGHILAQLSVM